LNRLIAFIQSIFCRQKSAEILNLIAQIKELDIENEELTNEIMDKNLLIEAYKVNEATHRQVKEVLEAEINTLKTSLAESIQIVDIAPLIDKSQFVNYAPWVHHEELRANGRSLTTADLVYHSLPQEMWDSILPPIQKEVRKHLGTFKAQIADCDDFALIMQSFVAIAFARVWPKVSLQAAFLTTWSRSHAYNAYVTTQYETNRIWFPSSPQ
jgi:chromosome segregation ATPase